MKLFLQERAGNDQLTPGTSTDYVALVPLLHTCSNVRPEQRIAFGERAGQRVRRIGSGFGYEGEHPTLSRDFLGIVY
jgi:hypothetical protein